MVSHLPQAHLALHLLQQTRAVDIATLPSASQRARRTLHAGAINIYFAQDSDLYRPEFTPPFQLEVVIMKS
jgi:hypothetical protein